MSPRAGKRFEELGRRAELVHLRPGAPDLKGEVGIRSGGNGKTMSARKVARSAVVNPQWCAGVVALNDVDLGCNGPQLAVSNPSRDASSQRMREVDKAALRSNPRDRLLRGQLGRNCLGHKECSNASMPRSDFFPDDHSEGRKFLQAQGTFYLVVIQDCDSIKAGAKRDLHHRFEGEVRVVGVRCVDM